MLTIQTAYTHAKFRFPFLWEIEEEARLIGEAFRFVGEDSLTGRLTRSMLALAALFLF